MKCTPASSLVFVFISLACGLACAATTKALQFYTPALIIAIRMVAGTLVIGIIMIIHSIYRPAYRDIVAKDIKPGFGAVLKMSVAGLMYQGIPHTMIAIAQQWVSSATAQLFQPIAPPMCAIFSHFILPDEPFNMQKLYSFIAAIGGVSLTAIPSFSHPSGGSSTRETIIGFLLLFGAVTSFGFATVYVKWRVPKVDGSVNTFYQLLASSVFTLIWLFASEGAGKTVEQIHTAPWYIFTYPVIVGIFASGLAVLGTLYLVDSIGAVGANFTTFGQIIVGVVVGVTMMNEWADYTRMEVIWSIIGILLLGLGIVVGFYKPSVPKGYSEIQFEQIITD